MKSLAKLFVLGDSISIGYGPELERMLAGRLAYDRKGYQLLGSQEIDSSLINGGDSRCVLEFLRAQAAQLPRSCCLLLNCGLHDLRVDPATGAHQVEPESYTRNLEQILYLARAAGAHVVWVRTTPVVDGRHNWLNTEFQRYNADIERYNALADRLMLVSETPSIDLYRFTLSLAEDAPALEDLYEDHVHFTQPVRRLQAAYIAGWLEASLLA